MSLIDQFTSQLKAMLGGSGQLCVAEGGLRLECALTEVQPLACTFEKLTLAADSLAGASMADLQKKSDELSSRLNYLLEPIGAVELDSEKCIVQMRSNPPQKDDDGTQYYELLVRKGGAITLCRYQQQPGNSRARIPAAVTQQVLLRLAGDFIAVV